MNKKTFEAGMAYLVECFTHKDISMPVAWDLLKDLDDRKFMIAVKDVCSTTKELYPGTNIIALIREIVLSGKDLIAGEAWEEVMEQVSKVGSYGKPQFKDMTTEKAVNCIGWKDICMSEKIAVERSHFMKIYDTLLKREKDNRVKIPEVKNLIEETTKVLNERN